MYAVGLTYYEMLFGDIPFTDSDISNMYQIKMNYQVRTPAGCRCPSQKSINILQGLFQWDYRSRLTAKNVLEMINGKNGRETQDCNPHGRSNYTIASSLDDFSPVFTSKKSKSNGMTNPTM
jgi:serine/threonine protein kinase